MSKTPEKDVKAVQTAPYLLAKDNENLKIAYGFDAAIRLADTLAQFAPITMYALKPVYQFAPQIDGSVKATEISTGEQWTKTLEKH